MKEETYTTTSLWGTALAMARGVKLLGVLPRTPQRPRDAFILDNTGGRARKAMDDYLTGDPLVPLRQFITARTILLERMAQAHDTPQEAARG